MSNIELYNKYYNGLRFVIIYTDKLFKLNGIVNNEMVDITGFNSDGSSVYIDIDTVLSSIKYKYWKLNKLDMRKRKVQLLKNDN